MNDTLEYILANKAVEILSTSSYSRESYGKFQHGKLEVGGALTPFQQVKELLDFGLNPLAITDCSDETSPKILLSEVINHSYESKVVNLLIDYLKPKNLVHLPDNVGASLLESFATNADTSIIARLFDAGFKLKQGNDDTAVECDLARIGRLDIFEIIHNYQPEFNFNKKYSGMTLKDMVVEEAPYYSEPVKQKNMENLFLFLKTVERYENLQETLPEKNSTAIKAKI